MLNILKTTEEGLRRLDDFEPGAWVDLVSPTEQEVTRVAEGFDIPLAFLRGPLDEEEKSRIDVEGRLVYVIVDIPVRARNEDDTGYDTIPLGILLHPDTIITTCLRANPILGDFERGLAGSIETFKKTRFLLLVLLRISTYYLRYLKRIDRETDTLERELRASMKNRELFELLNIQKALVYFSTSLQSNEVVLNKLLRGKTVKMYEEDEDLLEDVIVENKQAMEMASIYSNILTGLMDAFASVISNNLNMVMKLLTSITIILAVPAIVAGFFGMNVAVPFVENPYGFLIVVAMALGLAVAATVLFWRKRFF
jgi:magnesium transporter